VKWYVVQALTGKEKAIRDRIKRLEINISAVVPERSMLERRQGSWRNVQRVLFPGYVFIPTEDLNDHIYCVVKSVPGVIRFLGRPTPILEKEVTYLLRWSIDGDPLGLSEVLVAGTKVEVISGPLKGLEGQILKLDARRFRAKVNISLMGEPRIVELAANIIKKS
jgi:transcriptional antiterminator NusG